MRPRERNGTRYLGMSPHGGIAEPPETALQRNRRGLSMRLSIGRPAIRCRGHRPHHRRQLHSGSLKFVSASTAWPSGSLGAVATASQVPVDRHRPREIVIAAGVNEVTASFAGLCQVRKQILKSPIGDRPMQHTQFPSISDASATSWIAKRKPNPGRSVFACLIDALHASRRLHAARAIRQHRHLFHEARGQEAGMKVKQNL
jgi:hypothetical protein